MVTTIAVMYPNGRIPTSLPTMPAKTIKTQALTKNSGPAAMSLKNASTINHLRFRFTTGRDGQASADRPLDPGLLAPARALIGGDQLELVDERRSRRNRTR